jgi:hypothetical protein
MIWILRCEAASKYQVSNQAEREGQNSSTQNGQYQPSPKLRARLRHPQHVHGDIGLIEIVRVVRVVPVSQLVCHAGNTNIALGCRLGMYREGKHRPIEPIRHTGFFYLKLC